MLMDTSPIVYIPVVCNSCMDIYGVLRVQFGHVIQKDDLFLCSKYLRLKYLLKSLFLPFINLNTGSIKCPNCDTPLSSKDVYSQAAMALAKKDNESFQTNWMKSSSEFVRNSILRENENNGE